MTRETLLSFARAIKQQLNKESEQRESVSSMEWELIQPTQSEEAQSTIETVSNLMKENNRCCVRFWAVSAVETAVPTNKVLRVASWTPLAGLDITDNLFPHVQGVRLGI